jgi:hypothetical protein
MHCAARALGVAEVVFLGFVDPPTESGGPLHRIDATPEEYASAECQWQRAQLPQKIRALVLDDQKLRNELCWFVFDC